MEIAVLSDIHGNYVALERCMHIMLFRKETWSSSKTEAILGDGIESAADNPYMSRFTI